MEKVTKFYKLVLLLACMFGVQCLVACNKTCYFEKKGIYLSSSPYIKLNCMVGNGTMIIDGTTYQLHLSYANDGSYIKIYDEAIIEQLERDEDGHILELSTARIWKADTKEENGKLYLTVTEDTISDYVGKTIVLEFQPYE